MDWPDLWHTLSQYEANQSFYYFLLHLWMNLGQSEFVLRSLSVIFALGVVVMMYVFGTHLNGVRTGMTAALLITVNAFFITYAQEARSYMLALLLSTLSSYFFINAIEKSGYKWWSAYVLCTALGVYTHLYVVFVLVAQYASIVFLPRRMVPWKSLIISGTVTVALLIPMVYFALTRDIGQIGWIWTPDFLDIVKLFNRLAGQGGPALLIVYFLPSAAACIYFVRKYFEQRMTFQLWRYTFLLCWLILPVIISFLFSYVKPIFVQRYFIIVIPPLIFFAATGLNLIKKRWLMVGALAIIVSLSCLSLRDLYAGQMKEEYYIEDYNLKDDWRGVTNYIIDSARPDDAIVFYHPIIQVGYEYYHNRINAPDNVPAAVYYLAVPGESLNLYYLPQKLSLGKSIPDPDSSIIDRLNGYERVWLVLGYTFNKEKEQQSQMLQGFLQEKYDLTEEKDYYWDIRVYLYRSKDVLP
jgi:uncharacterized membrane protein